MAANDLPSVRYSLLPHFTVLERLAHGDRSKLSGVRVPRKGV
ncbi:hypothetical protein FRACA_3200008 [Frankia canadensis]|uniref:Uncharacterized protein n=1 Tax=Frankia canadensis TaxID=1836972 RepID=A0A2I2KUL2_9ACTN|nr:hypothetical protein FRACA_3200008 [Frankia canadensis]SOU56646.1 hypothetical protein FRACA_3200008 [Frankia canadensis]